MTSQSLKRRNAFSAIAFLFPFLLMNGAFLVYPFLKGIWMSLHSWDLLGREHRWVGFRNYARMFSDPLFWTSVWHTIEFSLITVPAITVTSLLLALVLNSRLRRYAILRAIFFATGVFSVTVVTLIWLTVLNPSRGIVGLLFHALGLEPVDVLASRLLALPAVSVATIWWSVGLPMAIFLSGLQQIPKETYEAAELDHASRWTILTQITLPALKRTTWLVVLLQVILQFQIFGQVLLMTRGGPAYATHVLVQYIYEAGFRDWEVGYASTLSLFLFVVMFLVSLIRLRVGNRGAA
ncbi:MAG: carbohydrate ABC transporter permease [Bdellovibrionia bacterium]